MVLPPSPTSTVPSSECQRGGFANVEYSDIKQAGGCIVGALGHTAVSSGCCQSCRKQVSQRISSRLSGTIVGNFDLEHDQFALFFFQPHCENRFGARVMAIGT